MVDVFLHGNKDQGGISAKDAIIGIYGAYYIGAHGHEVKNHLNYNFNLRATNIFGMENAMAEAFARPESPWIILEHDTDAATKKSGAHFIALYHRESGEVMIALPGLETDYRLEDSGRKVAADTLADVREMAIDGMRGQSAALYRYTKQIEEKMAAGVFKGEDGKPLPLKQKPLIGAHSMGCTAAQMMALDGYQTILIEPRPVHDGLLRRLTHNLSRVTGDARMSNAAALEKLDEATTNIRTQQANCWNSLILPWVKQHGVGNNYAYGFNDRALNGMDHTILTSHRIEETAASTRTQRAEGMTCFRESMFLQAEDKGARRTLGAELLAPRDKGPGIPGFKPA